MNVNAFRVFCWERSAGLVGGVRLLFLIELQACAEIALSLFVGEQSDRLGLPFHRGLEITRFGVCGGEAADQFGVLPHCQLARPLSRFNRLLPVAELRVRTCCPEPRKAVESVVLLRINPDRLVEVCDRLVIFLLAGPGRWARVGVEDAVLRIEPDSLAEVSDSLIVVILERPGGAAKVEGGRQQRVARDGVAEVVNRLVVFPLR